MRQLLPECGHWYHADPVYFALLGACNCFDGCHGLPGYCDVLFDDDSSLLRRFLPLLLLQVPEEADRRVGALFAATEKARI